MPRAPPKVMGHPFESSSLGRRKSLRPSPWFTTITGALRLPMMISFLATCFNATWYEFPKNFKFMKCKPFQWNSLWESSSLILVANETAVVLFGMNIMSKIFYNMGYSLTPCHVMICFSLERVNHCQHVFVPTCQRVWGTCSVFFSAWPSLMPKFHYLVPTIYLNSYKPSSTCPRRRSTSERSMFLCLWCWFLATSPSPLTIFPAMFRSSWSTCHMMMFGRTPTQIVFFHHRHRLIANSSKINSRSNNSHNQMFTQPPQWLVRWKHLMECLLVFKKNVFIYMMGAVRLRMMPREWLQTAIPPVMDHPVNQMTCDHPPYDRYGNATGRYAKYKKCQRRWKWDNQAEAWLDWSASLSARSRPLPLPSPGAYHHQHMPRSHDLDHLCPHRIEWLATWSQVHHRRKPWWVQSWTKQHRTWHHSWSPRTTKRSRRRLPTAWTITSRNIKQSCKGWSTKGRWPIKPWNGQDKFQWCTWRRTTSTIGTISSWFGVGGCPYHW